MADAKMRQQWDHTSAVIATIYEVNRNSKKRSRPFKPYEFHPWYARKRIGYSLNDEKTWGFLETAFHNENRPFHNAVEEVAPRVATGPSGPLFG